MPEVLPAFNPVKMTQMVKNNFTDSTSKSKSLRKIELCYIELGWSLDGFPVTKSDLFHCEN